jgi:hypothetical protein
MRSPAPGAKVEVLDRGTSMGLGHCPLCMALAIYSVVRCGACATLLWRLA